MTCIRLIAGLCAILACCGSEGGDGAGSSAGTGGGAGTVGGSSCGGSHDPAARRIATESGTVIGIAARETDAFLGIPYVKAPVGELRWAEPQPLGCFDAEFIADVLGARCVQLSEDQQSVVGEEDCLQLNIWTPAARAEPLPVLVFIHGGGHAIGSAVDPIYDGAALAAFGEGSVVVTINYRLGALGYLQHPQVPANLGLRDQVAALQWVNRNVEAFGGDPSRVTVFGESAGAVSTCALMGVPEADELFQRAIVQSGSCRQRVSVAYAPVSQTFLTNAGCAGQSDELACLRALPAEQVVRTEPTGFPDVAGFSQSWSPYVDGVLLPRTTEQRWVAGDNGGVRAVIIGSNRDETANSVPPGLTEQQYESLIRSVAPLPALADQVLEQYPVADYVSPTEAYIALTSEVKFICGARRAAMAASNALNSRLYMFSYDQYTKFNAEPKAFHGIELVFLFGSFDTIGVGAFIYQPNETDRQMSTELMTRWTGFARDGIPTASDGLDWPLFPDGYLVLDTPSRLGAGDYPEKRCDFWDALLFSL